MGAPRLISTAPGGSRCKADTASGNRQHHEGEYRALSDEKQLTHGQLLSCESPNVVTWQGSDCSLGQWVWGNSLSARYISTDLLPVAAWTLSPRAEMVSLRHMPPAQVPVLNNSAFDLMTRSAFIAQDTRGIRAIRNPLTCPKDWEIRQAIAIRRETEDDNRSDFAAGDTS